jgi:beta-glucanase (GH16 family)
MRPFFFITLRNAAALLILPVWVLASGNSYGATLFFDDFNGTSLDESVWRLPTGVGTYFGRTQIKPPTYAGQDLRPIVAGGSVTLSLDTYNASALTPGDSFWGHEIQTLQTFLPGTQGVSVETRMRFLDTPPGGLVGGFFTWGFDGAIRDEIIVELLTNDLDGDRFLTNLYNNADFSGPGDSAFATIPGYDMTNWNTYEIRWLPDRIQWFLNGMQVREVIATVAGHPSEVRLNIWAPNAFFSDAYNAALQPVSSAAENQQYELEIDFVRVSEVPIPPAIWLFGSGLLGLIGISRHKRGA